VGTTDIGEKDFSLGILGGGLFLFMPKADRVFVSQKNKFMAIRKKCIVET